MFRRLAGKDRQRPATRPAHNCCLSAALQIRIRIITFHLEQNVGSALRRLAQVSAKAAVEFCSNGTKNCVGLCGWSCLEQALHLGGVEEVL